MDGSDGVGSSVHTVLSGRRSYHHHHQKLVSSRLLGAASACVHGYHRLKVPASDNLRVRLLVLRQRRGRNHYGDIFCSVFACLQLTLPHHVCVPEHSPLTSINSASRRTQHTAKLLRKTFGRVNRVACPGTSTSAICIAHQDYARYDPCCIYSFQQSRSTPPHQGAHTRCRGRSGRSSHPSLLRGHPSPIFPDDPGLYQYTPAR